MNDDVLEKIYKSGLKFLVPLTPEVTHKLIVDESIKLLDAEYGSLFLDGKNGLERVYASSPGFYKIKNRPRGSMYQVFKQQKMKILNVSHLSRIHPFLKQVNIHSIIAAPLSYRNISIGVLALQSTKKQYFSEKTYKILRLFTPLATLSIRKTQLYDETRKALETRDLFISMAAHELRTPLTSVNGYAQLLKSKLGGANTPESRWVEQLYWETNRLTLLVNELLEINNIKNGKFQYYLKECKLRDILVRVCSDFKFSHPERKLEIEDELGNSSDQVIGDYDKILQVFTNLVDNAVKFSQSNTQVLITLNHKNSYLVVQVQDQGIGIHKQDISKILEGFHHGKGHDREGLGLGLFLVKDIVTRLHGKLKIHSKPNQGTRVEVSLPKLKP
ncbi:GAF domain-containing sensor histidine kinase [Candidatus Daviesbacteria bacterium]|nr:GAF domain-containing sensor histidine kinase [Candidatus Daviesbacteria bacterium]